MSLPNLASDSGDRRDPVAMPLDASDESASVPREEPGYRAATEFGIESGLDGFVSEDGDSDPSSLLTTAQPGDTVDGDGARLAPSGRSERAAGRQSRSTANVLSMATRAISQARGSVAGMSGRARIATVVPRLIHSTHLDRLASTAALVGQTGARVTQSLSSTLTQPRWRVDPRLAFLVVLSFLGFAGLWSVTQRLSNPAASLAESAGVSTEPVVTESVEDVVSQDTAVRLQPTR